MVLNLLDCKKALRQCCPKLFRETRAASPLLDVITRGDSYQFLDLFRALSTMSYRNIQTQTRVHTHIIDVISGSIS